MNARERRVFVLCVALQALVVLAMVARKQAVLIFGRQITLKTNPVDPHSLFRGDYARLRTPVHAPEAPGWEPWPAKRGARVFAELAPSGTSWNLVAVHQARPTNLPDSHVVLRGKVLSHGQWAGQPVFDLVDLSSPGWLNRQSENAAWRSTWKPSGHSEQQIYHRGTRLPEGSTVYVVLSSFDGKDWHLQTTQPDDPRSTTRLDAGGGTITLKGRVGPHEEWKTLEVDYGIESFFIPEGKGRQYERGGLDMDVAVSRSGHAVVRKIRLPSDEESRSRNSGP